MNMFKKNGGFTLVELIVVIAILAILAGVAIPAYSGYITKANEAADTQSLSAMNTAFAAACTENFITPSSIADGKVSVTVTEGKVTGISFAADAGVEKATDIANDFDAYFAGNTASALKYYTSFNFVGGNFVGSK